LLQVQLQAPKLHFGLRSELSSERRSK